MKLTLSFLGVAVSLALAAPSDLNPQKPQIWAVLVAGSYGWNNYRHQADICHAYQIFRRHGVPDSNIIVMMFDDIAKNQENPKKGVIINKPEGPNVYKNVPKDYTGSTVSPENFLDVLKGKGKGKVLKSGENDKVFMYFADHGSTGLIGFPNGYLYADKLIKALKEMHKKKMYKELVFYMEACESGSMFEGLLPNNIEIYAMTASNSSESSWGCYCDTDLNTCLGDEFSVAWMEDIDSEEDQKKYNTEKIAAQFMHVKKRVQYSHVSNYGHTPIKKHLVEEFVGAPKNKSYRDVNSWSKHVHDSKVSSREMAVFYIDNKIKKAANEQERKALQKEKDALLQGRKSVDRLFAAILAHVTELDIPQMKKLEEARPNLSMEMMPCYRTLVDNFNGKCVNISKNTYALRHLYKLANLCLSQYPEEQVLEAMSVKCEDRHRQLVAID